MDSDLTCVRTYFPVLYILRIRNEPDGKLKEDC